MQHNAPFPCIAFALARESAPFLKLFPRRERQSDAPCGAWLCTNGERTVLVMETGVGQVRTQRALDWLTRHVNFAESRLVIAAGFAGALNVKARVGDVVLAEDVIDPEGNR